VVERDKLIRLVAVALATDAVSVMVAEPFDRSDMAACLAAAMVIRANRIAVRRHAVDQLVHVPLGTARSAASFGSTCMVAFDGSVLGTRSNTQQVRTTPILTAELTISTIATA